MGIKPTHEVCLFVQPTNATGADRKRFEMNHRLPPFADDASCLHRRLALHEAHLCLIVLLGHLRKCLHCPLQQTGRAFACRRLLCMFLVWESRCSGHHCIGPPLK